MDNTLYVGLSRQMTLRRELDVIANNIANADTAGFKLESLMVNAEERPLDNGEASTSINFNLDNGVARDFSQGGLKQTGATYDLAVEGDGFFKIGTDNGERYTRDGRFGVDGLGKLVNASSHPVLDEGGGEITLDPVLGEPTIGADGTVSQKGQVVGKIGVARFGSLAALSKDGDGLYRNVSNLQPEAATDSKVRQGMIETSNVQPIVQITRLIEVSRTYESIARMMSQTSELSSQAIDRLAKVA